MRKIPCLITVFMFVLTACSKENLLEEQIVPLPEGNPDVSILGVGNSWTLNAIEYLGYVLHDIGVEVEIGLAYYGGSSLQQHAEWISKKSRVLTFRHFWNGTWEAETSARYTHEEIFFARQWDFVTMQQVSNLAGQYATYQPYLHNILNYMQNTLSYTPTYLMHATWSYPFQVPAVYNYDTDLMYRANLQAYNQAMLDEGIHYIMPSAPAIQQLRQWPGIANVDEADGRHLASVGKFAAACVWAEMLVHHLRDTGDGLCITHGTLTVEGVSPELGARIRTLAHEIVHDRQIYFPACH